MIRRILNKLESVYYYRYFSKVKNGATNTLLKKIYKSTDIVFIEKCFQLDFFREIVNPVELELENKKEILVLAPHQDDELIGLGGTLLKYKKKGAKITLVFLTDGASLDNSAEIVKIRSAEANKVAKELNAELIEIGIPNDTMLVNQKHLSDLTALLKMKKWDEIFSVWPIDNPPKHRLCAYLLYKILKVVNDKALTITLYSVHTELIPNKYSDITAEYSEKQRLIKLYESQLISQAHDHLAMGRDAWSSRFLNVSQEKRYIEIFFKVNFEEYSKLMNVYNNVNVKELFKANQVCINAFNSLKN